jgi:hypothetical protein
VATSCNASERSNALSAHQARWARIAAATAVSISAVVASAKTAQICSVAGSITGVVGPSPATRTPSMKCCPDRLAINTVTSLLICIPRSC